MGISRWLRKLHASKSDLEVLNAVDNSIPSTIEDLPEDITAKVIGRVEALDAQRLMAPISKLDVLGWGYKIDSLDIVTAHMECRPFGLVDGKSRAIVDPEHARVLISATAFRKCRGVTGSDDRSLHALLRSAGATDPKPTFFHRSGQRSGPSTYRLSEWVIQPGMLLAVVGRGVRESDPRSADGYRGHLTLIRIAGAHDAPLAITNEL